MPLSYVRDYDGNTDFHLLLSKQFWPNFKARETDLLSLCFDLRLLLIPASLLSRFQEKAKLVENDQKFNFNGQSHVAGLKFPPSIRRLILAMQLASTYSEKSAWHAIFRRQVILNSIKILRFFTSFPLKFDRLTVSTEALAVVKLQNGKDTVKISFKSDEND